MARPKKQVKAKGWQEELPVPQTLSCAGRWSGGKDSKCQHDGQSKCNQG